MSPSPPAPQGPLHIETPLVHVPFLSQGKHNIFLKLETQQLSGSFKMRGIGHACLTARQKLGPDVHIVVASGAAPLALSPAKLRPRPTLTIVSVLRW
jgi:L-serine/L-threonine ammonia-lyase